MDEPYVQPSTEDLTGEKNNQGHKTLGNEMKK